MRTPKSLPAINSIQLTFTNSFGIGWILAVSLGSLLLGAVPAVAKPENAEKALTRHLERLEQELSTRSAVAEEPGQARRLLRQARFLRHLARENATAEFRQRLDAFEIRVRTGKSRALRAPASNLASPDKQGAVGGTVTRASSGAPLSGVSVFLWDASGFLVQIADTNPSGTYSFDDLDAGQYFASTENFDGFVDELYDDIPCPGGGFVGCDPTTGEPIAVVDQGTAQIDFALDLGGSITGAVTAAGSGEPLHDVVVQVWNAAGNFAAESFSDAQGSYRIDGLGAGTYFATTENFDDYRDELYDDLPCPGGGFFGCDPTTGDGITVTLETTTSGIDFALDQLGSIIGQVTDGLSGDPIPFVDLIAWDAQGSFTGSGFSDESGQYQINGLDEGTYFVTTSNFWGFDDELFDNLPCTFGNCDPTTGTPIAVNLDTTTTGVDFVLTGGCVDSDTVLCLNGDRFRVETSWRDFADNSGPGQAVELTDDTGYFWFFADTNVEQVVKVLNACGLPGFNNYWVFAGGLTSVEVTLTVTDVQSGQSKEYTNALGTPFQPIQDTGAFATCP